LEASGIAMDDVGRGGKLPRVFTRSYITMAPAMATLMQKAVGIRMKLVQRSRISSDSEPASGPST
jgi:hypothetical protein